jgi:NADPH2:quinone reductase
MKAVRIDQTGGPEVLQLANIAQPTPGPGEVLIQHQAIGLNFIDIYQRSGLYPMPLPSGLGLEAAGEVIAIGEGVTRFKIGDRAAYCNTIGAYAEANVVKQDRAVRLPEGVSSEVAAACLLKGLTAEFLARRIRPLSKGETVLVHAAAGGVGLILCQWLKVLGIRVIGSVGSAQKRSIALSHGCEEVLVSSESDFAKQVRDLTGGLGVSVVYDSVGADTFESSLSSLARRGMMVCFGNASGPAPAVEPLRLSRGGSLFLTRPTLFDYVATVDELDRAAEALFAVIASGDVKIEIGQRFALDQIAEAHRTLASRATTGATVITL